MTERIIKIIKKHKTAVLLAIICGFVYLWPHIFFNYSADNYSGIIFTTNDAENHYMARVKEVSEGKYDYASTYLYEYKNVKMPVLLYGEIVYGLILKVIPISVQSLFLVSKFVFSIINFLLLYYFVFLVTKNKTSSLFSAIFIFFAYLLVDPSSLKNFFSILFWQTDKYSTLVYGRFINPLLSYPFFFFGLVRIYLLYKKPTVKNSIYFGISLGACFYIYFYYWFYLLALSCVIMLFFLIKKQWLAIKKYILSLLTAGLIGFYYLNEMKSVFWGEFQEKTGGTLNVYTNSHQIIISRTIIIIFIFFLAYLFYLKMKKKVLAESVIFLLLLIISSILVTNQQVISGVLIEEGHFHWYINKPVSIIILCFLFFAVLDKFKANKFKKALVYFLMLMMILFGVGVQASGYKKDFAVYRAYNRYGEVIDWLNENSRSETVVLTNSQLSELIPAYTNNNVYYSLYAIFYQTNPLERRKHSAHVYHYLEYPGEKMSATSAEFYCRKYVYFCHNCIETKSCPKDLVNDMLNEYNNEILKINFEDILKRYRIDYIVWDKKENPEWRIDDFDFVEEIFNDQDIVLYKVI